MTETVLYGNFATTHSPCSHIAIPIPVLVPKLHHSCGNPQRKSQIPVPEHTSISSYEFVVLSVKMDR